MNFYLAPQMNLMQPEFHDFGIGFGGRLIKKKWSALEDHHLSELVNYYGTNEWVQIASHMPGRNSRQCRERWKIRLNPDVVKGEWTAEEDELIMSLYNEKGNKWVTMSKALPRRTESDVRNRCYALERARRRETTSELTPLNTENTVQIENLSDTKSLPANNLQAASASSILNKHNNHKRNIKSESSEPPSFVSEHGLKRDNLMSSSNRPTSRSLPSDHPAKLFFMQQHQQQQQRLLNHALLSQSAAGMSGGMSAMPGPLTDNSVYLDQLYRIESMNAFAANQYQPQLPLQHQQGFSDYGMVYPPMHNIPPHIAYGIESCAAYDPSVLVSLQQYSGVGNATDGSFSPMPMTDMMNQPTTNNMMSLIQMNHHHLQQQQFQMMASSPTTFIEDNSATSATGMGGAGAGVGNMYSYNMTSQPSAHAHSGFSAAHQAGGYGDRSEGHSSSKKKSKRH